MMARTPGIGIYSCVLSIFVEYGAKLLSLFVIFTVLVGTGISDKYSSSKYTILEKLEKDWDF